MEYLLKVSFGLFLMWLPYLVFKGERWFQTNRYYLLLILALSILAPLLPSFIESTKQNFAYSYILEPIDMVIGGTVSTHSTNYLTWIYCAITSIMVVWLIVRLAFLLRIILGSKEQRKIIENSSVIQNANLPGDFSFFRWIFISSSTIEKNIIIQHEKIHVEQMHSIDIFFVEIYLCFFWFNPIAWLIKKQIALNHEYIADEAILKQVDKSKYKETLLSNSIKSSSLIIGSTFSYYKLKNRFIMMNQLKKKKLSYKFLAIIPMFAVLFIAYGFNFKNQQEVVYESSLQSDPEKNPDVMPEYPGGMEVMASFIGKNLKYPKAAEKAAKSGKVILGFIVNESGKVMHAKVIKGFDAECEQEALRVVNAMPNWTPGKKDGQSVSVEMVLPIVFKLD